MEKPKTEWREVAPINVRDLTLDAKRGALTFLLDGIKYVYRPDGDEYETSATRVFACVGVLEELRKCSTFRIAFEVGSRAPADRKVIFVTELSIPVQPLK